MKNLSYSEYISSCLNTNNQYSEYIAENIQDNIEYTEYIANHINTNIQYSEYIAENLYDIIPNKYKKVRKIRQNKIKELFNSDIYDEFNKQCDLIKNNNNMND